MMTLLSSIPNFPSDLLPLPWRAVPSSRRATDVDHLRVDMHSFGAKTFLWASISSATCPSYSIPSTLAFFSASQLRKHSSLPGNLVN